MCDDLALVWIVLTLTLSVQMLALMERFYEPLDGLVLLDDTDLSTYDPSWLHSQIAYASQVLSHPYHVMVQHACVREEPFLLLCTR